MELKVMQFWYCIFIYLLSQCMTKPKNGMCTQLRLRSVWASAHSDQSLCYALNGYLRTWAFFMRTAKTDQTGWMPRLIWVFAGHTCHFVGFVMRWLSLLFLYSLNMQEPILVIHIWKCAFWAYTYSKYPDQFVHLRGLIRSVTVFLQNHLQL